MPKSKITANVQKTNIIRSKVFQGISIDIRNKFLSQLPWIVSIKITAGEALKRLDEVPLNTLFVVDDENKLAGVITKNGEALKGCKGGAKTCQETCDSACADRGGCAFILWDPWGGSTKCRFECNDQFDEEQTVDVWF